MNLGSGKGRGRSTFFFFGQQFGVIEEIIAMKSSDNFLDKSIMNLLPRKRFIDRVLFSNNVLHQVTLFKSTRISKNILLTNGS